MSRVHWQPFFVDVHVDIIYLTSCVVIFFCHLFVICVFGNFVKKMKLKLNKKKGAALMIMMMVEHVVRKRIQKKKVKRKIWVREWIQRRSQLGFYDNLMQELRMEDPSTYKNFTRIVPTDFDFLVEKLTPLIQRKDTVMRKAITVGERLAVTLRFLATGDSYASLSFLFRIPTCTISRVIPETCGAIYQILKDDYLKVIVYFYFYLEQF